MTSTLQTLTELMAKGTPGTWREARYGNDWAADVVSDGGTFVAGHEEDDQASLHPRDAALICAMHSAMPALLAIAEVCRDAKSLTIMDPSEYHLRDKLRTALRPLTADGEKTT